VPPTPPPRDIAPTVQRIRLRYAKRGRLRFASHRDFQRAFERAVSAVPEITECFLTTGEADYILRVLARDAADIERVHSSVLTKLPGVARVESSFVLREIVSGGAPPLERGR
jgi:DNA-binding Lrp family transcriptional regulator